MAMDLTIELTGLAREITGVKEIPLEISGAATYKNVVSLLGQMYPGLTGVIISEDDESLLSSVLLIRNGLELVMPDQMGGSPSPGDRLSLIFVIVGGM